MIASTSSNSTAQREPQASGVSVGLLIALVVAVLAGGGAAIALVPMFAPALAQSVSGDAPRAFWYLTRATGFVAYILLWMSTVFGLLISSKAARAWPGGPTALDLHQYTSWFSIGFTIIHALVLLGEKYITYDLVRLFVPFASVGYRPEWVGIGQIGLYLAILVSVTFYMRKFISYKAFRVIHFASYVMFALTLAHGLLSGSDTGVSVVDGMYWVSAISIVALTAFRTVRAVAK